MSKSFDRLVENAQRLLGYRYALLYQLPRERSEALPISELRLRGKGIGLVRRALASLLSTGNVRRRWDGNARFGRYLYWIGRNVPKKIALPQ